jgi:aminoglycoside phosphotransferase (APT) family kinase protein
LTATADLERVGRGLDALLEHSQVAHYLLALGLVNPRAIIDEDLRVIDVSRRNSVFLATTSRGPSYVVKQPGPGTANTLAHEAAVLHALARMPSLAGLVPELAHYDDTCVRLVLRSPGDAIAWAQQPRLQRLAARALGRALAAVHAARPEVEGSPRPHDRLWALSLPEPALDRLRVMSTAELDLLSRVQASHALCDRLVRLRDDVAEEAFVHGDIRWENCLAAAAPGSRRRTRVLLIDWELAGAGDPTADLGAALGECLRLWVGSVPIVDPSNPGVLVSRARHPLNRLRPVMRALWDGYRSASARPVPLRRVAEMAAVRLLQTAMEHAQRLVSVSAEALTLLQLADNVLRTPEDAASRLMGLHE